MAKKHGFQPCTRLLRPPLRPKMLLYNAQTNWIPPSGESKLSLFSTPKMRTWQTQIGHLSCNTNDRSSGSLNKTYCGQALGSRALHAVHGALHPRLDQTSRGDAPIPSRVCRRPKQTPTSAGWAQSDARRLYRPSEWIVGLAFSILSCLPSRISRHIYTHFVSCVKFFDRPFVLCRKQAKSFS